MKRQRGDAIISLLLYAGAAIAIGAFLWGAWHGFVTWVSAPRVEAAVKAQIKADQVVVDKANSDRDDWKRQTDDAKADTAACVASLKLNSEAVKKWQDQAAANMKAAQDAKAANLIANAKAKQAQESYLAIVRAPPARDLTCEQRLAKVDKLLRDAATARAAGAGK